MDDVGRYLWSSALLILLTVLAMFFSASDVSIISLSASKMRKLSEEGDTNTKAKELLRLKENQVDACLWISTSATLCITAACCYGTYIYTPLVLRLLASWFDKPNLSIITTAALVITFIIMAFVTFVIGATLPRKLVSAKPEEFAFFSVTPLKSLSYIFKPLTFLIIKTTRGLTRIFGVNPDAENSDVTEAEIRMLVDAGNENGTIELSECEMINNIFEFDDITAGDVMTHRTDLVAVEKREPLENVIKVAIEEGFSRIPVYDEVIDNIVGILYVKDLLQLLCEHELGDKTIENFIRSAIYIPETTRCRVLFKEFKEKKTHMAVIVDEYGGTAGIATMEDLIESIVGNIQDEYDQEEEQIKIIDSNTYSLDGSIDIEDVEKLFDVNLPTDEDTDTLGGLIVDTLGRIPQDDETPTVVIGELELTVMLVIDRRVIRVKAHKIEKSDSVDDLY